MADAADTNAAGLPAPPALLVLEDGTAFSGTACGAPGEAFGEICFNTSLSGYQEVLTDPSYRGQIVTMTMPPTGAPKRRCPTSCGAPARWPSRAWTRGV